MTNDTNELDPRGDLHETPEELRDVLPQLEGEPDEDHHRDEQRQPHVDPGVAAR